MRVLVLAIGVAMLALAPTAALAADLGDGQTFSVPKHDHAFICFFGANPADSGCVPARHHGHGHHRKA